MSGAKEALRAEVAVLSQTVRELRDEVAALRAAAIHHCAPVTIWQPSYPVPGAPPVPWYVRGYEVTCGSGSNMTTGDLTITTVN